MSAPTSCRGKDGGAAATALKAVGTGKDGFKVLLDMLRMRDCGMLEVCEQEESHV